MSKRIDSAKRVINGTWGEVWVNGEKIAECIAGQGKITKNKTTVNLCGQFMEDSKAVSGAGTGSLTLYHVDSGFARRAAAVQRGEDERATIIQKLADPDSWGAQRVAYYNCSFDDVTLNDWKAATVGQITVPYTFTSCELLDEIEVQ